MESLTQYVEPLIGTAHCRWFHFAPGAMPFGLAKPAAATNASLGNKSGWEATGYDYRDTSIEGFPCLHEFQVGGIVLMPTEGDLKTIPGPLNSNGQGYRSSLDHKDEIATAGYYSVMLKDYNVKAELTATPRVAFQRFTFHKSDASHILFDIGIKLYIDILNYKLKRKIEYFENNIDIIKNISNFNEFNDIIRKIEIINDFQKKSSYNVNKELFINNFIITFSGGNL